MPSPIYISTQVLSCRLNLSPAVGHITAIITRQSETMISIDIAMKPGVYQACKWKVKQLPEKISAQKLRHIVSRVC